MRRIAILFTLIRKPDMERHCEAVTETMACAIWRAQNEMNPLGQIFRNKLSPWHTRLTNCENLCQPVPGHPK